MNRFNKLIQIVAYGLGQIILAIYIVGSILALGLKGWWVFGFMLITGLLNYLFIMYLARHD